MSNFSQICPHRKGWEILYLSSVTPRFSISLVTSAISSFNLWEQTGRKRHDGKQEKWLRICVADEAFVINGISFVMLDPYISHFDVVSTHTHTRFFCLSQCVMQGCLFQIHLWLPDSPKRRPSKTPKCRHDSLSLTNSFFLSAGVMWNSRTRHKIPSGSCSTCSGVRVDHPRCSSSLWPRFIISLLSPVTLPSLLA